MKVQEALEVLREAGYYVDNLYHTSDITEHYECDSLQAMDILEEVLNSDYINDEIFHSIRTEAEINCIKKQK